MSPPPQPQGPITVHRDIRTYLPPLLSRFLGLRPPPPLKPLPIPPFSLLSHLPLKYEVWLLGLLGSFVGIILVEIVMATAFADDDIILIVASFGASAVLIYGTIESPLAQPRHLLGGHVISAIIGVALTRLFRKASGYAISDTTHHGDLGRVVWLNGAVSMSVALLAMQVTGTTHPPAGATALIASVQPAAVRMSWRFIYIVLISALLMLGWAMIINNIGRRKYPTYWLSGSTVFVRPPAPDLESGPNGRASSAGSGSEERLQRTTTDEVMMAAIEGRNDGMARMVRTLSREKPEYEHRHAGGEERGQRTSTDEVMMGAIEGRNDGMARLVRTLSREKPEYGNGTASAMR